MKPNNNPYVLVFTDRESLATIPNFHDSLLKYATYFKYTDSGSIGLIFLKDKHQIHSLINIYNQNKLAMFSHDLNVAKKHLIIADTQTLGQIGYNRILHNLEETNPELVLMLLEYDSILLLKVAKNNFK